MRFFSRALVRPLAAFGLAAFIAAPAVALFLRVTVHFAAGFDVSGSPNSSILADIGQISVVAPPTEFIVVPAASGGGELKIHDAGTTVEATLVGTFKTVFKGSQLDMQCTVRPLQDNSRLDIRLLDDSDSGMIDATFGGDGTITVNGVPVATYAAGVSYDLDVSLFDPLIGPSTWAVVISAPGGVSGLAVGVIPSAPSLTIKSVKLTRPAGVPAGTFFVDDLKAVSSTLTFK